MTDQTINFATATKAELEAAGYTTKTLKRRNARKGETHFTCGAKANFKAQAKADRKAAAMDHRAA